MKKIVLALLILAAVGGTAFSFNGRTFPSPIGRNSVLISPTFNLGFSGLSGWASGFGSDSVFVMGATVGIDYALPIPFALAVGLESGFATTTDAGFDAFPLPILFRTGWHPNFEVRGLDPYVVLKAGYSVGIGEGIKGGFSWGGGVGCRYFFNDIVGIFGELGYDRYSLGSWGGWISIYYYTFFHTGITFKIGGSKPAATRTQSKSAPPKTPPRRR